MSPATEAGLTCLREMRRNLRSAKGVVMGVLFLLGGAAASLIYAAVSELSNQQQNGEVIPEQAYRELREKVWTKVWQMACREEDIPEVGDHITYDIVGRSILVVRSAPGEIKAFRPGIGMIASRLGVPVVPVRIDGLDKVLHPSWKMARPG